MKEFEELQETPAVYSPPSTFFSTKNVERERPWWWQGHACLAFLCLVILLGLPTGHALGLVILSLPVLIFLNEGFHNTAGEEEGDATRACALEAFFKGLLLGPPLLALCEAALGLFLALVCFGREAFEEIISEVGAREQSAALGTLSTRLYRQAARANPLGATVFALLSSLLVAGLCEEVFKTGIGAWQVLKYREHRRTLRPGLVMAGAGLGLAYAESVLAIAGLDGQQRVIALVAAERVLTCFPIHVFCAVWTSRRAAREVVKPTPAIAWLAAVLPSALMHGVYDFGLLLSANYATSRFVGLGWGGLCSALVSILSTGIKP